MQRLRAITDEVLRALFAVQITPVLLNALDKGNQDLRSAVIEMVLALIYYDQVHDEEGARERLLTLAEHTEIEVSWPAALALGSLGDQQMIEPLVQLLNSKADHPWGWFFQEHLAATLRQLGETRAELEEVEQAVHDWRKTIQFKVKSTLEVRQLPLSDP